MDFLGIHRPVFNNQLISFRPERKKAGRRYLCLVRQFSFEKQRNREISPSVLLCGQMWQEQLHALIIQKRHHCISAKINSETYKAAATSRPPADQAVQSSCRLMLLQVIFQRMSSLSKHTFPLFLPPHISSFNLFLILTLGRLRYKVKTQKRLMRSSHSHLSSTMLIKTLSLSFPLSSSSA